MAKQPTSVSSEEPALSDDRNSPKRIGCNVSDGSGRWVEMSGPLVALLPRFTGRRRAGLTNDARFAAVAPMNCGVASGGLAAGSQLGKRRHGQAA